MIGHSAVLFVGEEWASLPSASSSPYACSCLLRAFTPYSSDRGKGDDIHQLIVSSGTPQAWPLVHLRRVGAQLTHL